MIHRTFKIIYEINGETFNTGCSEYSLHEYIDKILEDGSKVISIFVKDTKSKKPLKRIRKECSNLKEFSDRFIAFEKEELKKG